MIPHQFGVVGMSAGGQAAYRNNSNKPPMIHVRKRCGCGRQTTARDLAQYQCCTKCQKSLAR